MAIARNQVLLILQEIDLLTMFPKSEFGEISRVIFNDTLLQDLTSDKYSLDYLNLSHQSIEQDKIAPLTTALENNKTIKTLILSNNLELYAQTLWLLSSNRTITSLCLDHNNAGSNFGDIFAKRLKVNKTLTALYLGYNEIGDSGATAFGQYLALNTQLKTLDLSSNKIQDMGIIALVSGLAKNRSLTKLNLSTNVFGIKGAIALAEYLKENNTLESIGLDSCFKKDFKALKVILEGLKEKRHRSVLKELRLNYNNMREVGAIALAKVIEVNCGLKSLEIMDNNLADEKTNDEGIITIMKSVARHPSITRIDLRKNQISHGTGAIVKMLEENTRVISIKVAEENIPAMNEALPKINELLKKNKERVTMTGKWLLDHFSQSADVQEHIDRETLKYYQTCDRDLLIESIGKEDYEKVKKNVERYLATNYLKLIECVGNGKSTIEQLSPQTHLLIFSYLDLSKCLWFEEFYTHSTNNKADENTKSARDESNKSEGNKCNMW